MGDTKDRRYKEAGINGVVFCLSKTQNLRRECSKIRRDQIIIYSKGLCLDKAAIKKTSREKEIIHILEYSLSLKNRKLRFEYEMSPAGSCV